MSIVNARLHLQLVQNCEKIIGISVKCRVSGEAEVLWVSRSGYHIIEEDYAVIIDVVRNQVFPDGLVGAEPVGQNNQHLTHANHADIV